MISRRLSRLAGLAGLAVLLVLAIPFGAGATGPGHTLAAGTRFFTPPPSSGAVKQGLQLLATGKAKDALSLAKMEATPQAVWLTGGTPAQVRQQVKETMLEAALERAVPVFVVYNVPFRDCGQYSSGGASDTASYEAWIDGVAAGIGSSQAVVLVEPDGLGIIPYNTDINGNAESCKPDLTGTGLTPAQANAARYTQVNYAVTKLEQQPSTSVYLDATNSAWLSVGDIAQRLVRAGVQQAQGFVDNVSNYQYTGNSTYFSTWVSDCITYATSINPGDFFDCPNQYWNGGPPDWVGVALTPYAVWSDTATEQDLSTAGIDARYAGMLGSTAATTHFVIDTSRNGQGPDDMSAYAAAPYGQSASTVSVLEAGNWCNNPLAGLGNRPSSTTGVPLLDAYLWVKTPGQSDGQCDAAGGVRAWDYSAYTQPGWPTTAAAQALFDPLWGQVSPAAGAWFGSMALALLHNASPSIG
ncbi:MAG TPA: glycoside hydrolase family 6 protein [Gaiellaceae bacterium]|nr:glycoside hydrolase family 6 protein [Gaiellaceae bacterium]